MLKGSQSDFNLGTMAYAHTLVLSVRLVLVHDDLFVGHDDGEGGKVLYPRMVGSAWASTDRRFPIVLFEHPLVLLPHDQTVGCAGLRPSPICLSHRPYRRVVAARCPLLLNDYKTRYEIACELWIRSGGHDIPQ